MSIVQICERSRSHERDHKLRKRNQCEMCRTMRSVPWQFLCAANGLSSLTLHAASVASISWFQLFIKTSVSPTHRWIYLTFDTVSIVVFTLSTWYSCMRVTSFHTIFLSGLLWSFTTENNIHSVHVTHLWINQNDEKGFTQEFRLQTHE